MNESQPLFDQYDDWRHQPLVACAAFLRSVAFVELGRRPAQVKNINGILEHKALQSSSAKVYLRMFGTFVRWMELHNKTLFDVTNEDLSRFLDHGNDIEGVTVKVLNSAIRIRYLRLIERIMVYLQIQPNPAQHACFAAYRQPASSLAGRDAPKAVLDLSMQQDFMRALPAVPPATSRNALVRWKRQRDRAMQAVMLGAGLKVSEVLTLRTQQIGKLDSSGSVPINLDMGAANHTTRAHRTQLRPFAVQEVFSWLAVRERDEHAGKLLFPTTPDSNVPLNHVTVYRQVKATFERANIDPQRWGGRTLRNSFAVRELDATQSLELVGEFMGHRLVRSTRAYVAAAKRKATSKSGK